MNGRKLEEPDHKTFRPQSYCRYEDGTGRWSWLAPSSGIPLYGADKITAQPGTKVIVCEGEKAADAAQALFPERLTVTWYGGAQAVSKAPWHVLARRDVLIWPDPDTAGSRAAHVIVEQLQSAGCTSIAMLDVKALASLDPSNPEGPSRETPPKWDAADAQAEWSNVSRLRAEIDRNSKLLEIRPILVDPDVANSADSGITVDHFYAYLPGHQYIFIPTRELWPAASVNSRCLPVVVGGKKKPASRFLDENRAVAQMTWAPGEPELIIDRLVSDGGWIPHVGTNCFNLYRPPISQPEGDPDKAGPWLELIAKLFPRDWDHIVHYFAHRAQRPQEKINHSLVLGGDQGIGKDTILEPVKRAVGPWNVAEVSPRQILGRFNGFLKSVILRVNEARDLGEFDRFQFYDHVKNYMASPPDVLRVDEKNLREHNVLNCCAVIITTNHKTDGIYLPPDDRRHYVAWSDCTKDDFGPGYWTGLWNWYQQGGCAHVAAYLAQLDLSQFDPKAPPPKTAAFCAIADANRAPENAELADAIDRLGNPDALTLNQIRAAGRGTGLDDWINDRKSRRIIPHRLESCGYTPVRNDAAKDGLWKIRDTRMAIYAKKLLSDQQRLTAATALTR